MMIEEAIKEWRTLVVTIPSKNVRRLAAAVLVTPDGVAFADTWWTDSVGRHPLHFVPGKLSGDGPWKVGAAEFARIDHGDPLAMEHNGWVGLFAGKEEEHDRDAAVTLRAFVKSISP